jgi:hypothetical protein
MKLWLCALPLAFLAIPAPALMPPHLAAWRTKVVEWLPYREVSQLRPWVEQLDLMLSPQAFQAAFVARHPNPSVAWTYYAHWLYLERLDQTARIYQQRQRDLSDGREKLEEYLRRVEAASASQQPATLELEQPTSQVRLSESPLGLRLFRFLPWPEGGFSQTQLSQLAQAARSDRDQVEPRLEKLRQAETDFANHQLLWAQWLEDLRYQTRDFSQGQFLEPYGPPLSPPPSAP